MADTLIERVTGQATAADVNVEVGIVMPLEALLDPDAGGIAEIVGHGSIPAGIAHDLLASTEGRIWWRRLFTAPAHGPLVGCDPRRRRFDGVLAHLITIRDGGRCRDPFCDAPIRHLDHIDRRRAGGPTSFVNGRGTCARGDNLVPQNQVPFFGQQLAAGEQSEVQKRPSKYEVGAHEDGHGEYGIGANCVGSRPPHCEAEQTVGSNKSQ